MSEIEELQRRVGELEETLEAAYKAVQSVVDAQHTFAKTQTKLVGKVATLQDEVAVLKDGKSA